MATLTLLSTLLMGTAVVAVFVAVTRIGATRAVPRSTPEPVEEDLYDVTVTRIVAVLQSPAVWTAGFILLALGVGFGALVAVGSFGIPEAVTGPLFTVVSAVIPVLLAGFVFVGSYTAIRQRGLGHAHGIIAGVIALGAVLVLSVALQLVVGIV